MKFKAYLFESDVETDGSRLKYIENDEFKKLLKANCKDAVNAFGETQIYRGSQSILRVVGHFTYFGDTTNATPRKSRNTNNYYTLWMDNRPEWSKFPKRSKSFICTTDIETAVEYGPVYYVFPYDATEIGMCTDKDLWDSFRNYQPNSISSFTSGLSTFFGFAEDNWSDFTKQVKEVDSYENIGEFAKNGRHFKTGGFIADPKSMYFMKLYKHGWEKMKLEDILSEVFSPDGFKLRKAGDYLLDKKEVWFSGKALFLRRNPKGNIKATAEYLKGIINEA